MSDEVREIIVEVPTTVVRSEVLPGPPGPPGIGDMQKLIYDPRGFETDIFDISHMTGALDGGTF